MRYALLVLALLSPPAFAEDAAPTVNRVLDAWHAAAAKAREEQYFSYFAADAVFLGTDPGERWPREEFRKWAHPIFAKGKGWEIKPRKRHVYLSADRKTAWFDEDADSRELGPVRGTGVLVLEKGKWKVAQYNLSLPIPNEKFEDVRKLLEGKAR
jgi:hypothetical protein